jgi:hypothetical protein
MDSWDDAARARFDELNPPLCSFCEEREAGADGLCLRCSENADSVENNADVAELVRVARAHICSSGYVNHALSEALAYFPLTEREKIAEEARRSEKVIAFPGMLA